MWKVYMNFIDFLAKWHMAGYKEMVTYVVIPITLIAIIIRIILFFRDV